MTLKNSPITNSQLFLLVVVASLLAYGESQCCQAFSGGVCVSCPQGMHLFRGNCLYDLPGCAEYLQGFDCATCRRNYQLENGSCTHQRFPLSIRNSTNFTVFLQSSIKPDPLMTAAQQALQNSSQLWIDWYNHTLQLGKTYLNARSLTKYATELMKNATSTPKLHYILTATLQKGNDSLLFYRFVYELSLGRGFAECLLVVETLNGQQNYIELNDYQMKRVVDEAGWSEVVAGASDETYIIGRLTKLFPKIATYGYLKGYYKTVDEAVNYTMFFMSTEEGVVSFVYLADPTELPPINNTTTEPTKTVPAATPSSSQTNSPPSTTTTPQQNSTTKKASNASQNQTKSKDYSSNQTLPNQNTSSSSSSSSQLNDTNQIYVNASNLNSNPIFSVGYAVIIQQYQLGNCSLQQLFFFRSNNINTTVYGVYVHDKTANLFYRFTFTIDLTGGEFEIVNFTQSAKSLLPAIASTTTNTTSYSSNPSPVPSKTNQTTNSKQANDSHHPTSPAVNTTTASTSAGSAFSQNKSFSYCAKSGIEYIDITNKQSSDIFLPKINLLLHTMYDSLLTNTHITSAKYSLAIDPTTATSNITYLISYTNSAEAVFDFEVAIVNNQFQLISFPKNDPTSTTKTQEESKIDTVSEAGKEKNKTNQTTANHSNKTKQASSASQTTKESTKQSLNTNKNTSQSTTTASTLSEIKSNIDPAKSETTDTGKATLQTQTLYKNQTTHSTTINSSATINPTSNHTSTANTTHNPSSNTSTSSSNVLPTTTKNDTTTKASVNQPSNTSIPLVIDIPAKNYTTEPKYKSLITILRSIYRIPANASVASMTMWNDTNGDSRYEITFRMNYVNTLPDGSEAKLSIFNLTVNPTSFVSVQSEKIQFIKKSPPEQQEKLSPPPPPISANHTVLSRSPQLLPTNSSNGNRTASAQSQPNTNNFSAQPTSSQYPSSPPFSKLPSFPPPGRPGPPPPPLTLSGVATSPYLKDLYSIFTRHSPLLQRFTLRSLNFSSPPPTNGGIASFCEKLQFQGNDKSLCFVAEYEVTSLKGGPPQTDNQSLINLIQYSAINCSDSASFPIFSNITFTNELSFNTSVNQQLLAISKSNPVTLTLHQRWNSVYRVRFTASGFGEKQAVIDPTSALVLLYKTTSQTLYSQQLSNNSIITSSVAYALTSNMEKINRLTPNSLTLKWVGKNNDDADVMLLDVLAYSQVQQKWVVPLTQHFTLRALYWPLKNFIKIISANTLEISSNQYTLQLTNQPKWTLVSQVEAFNEPVFAGVLPSLTSAYPTFLQNSQIVAVYRENSNKTLRNCLTADAGGLLLIAFSKQFAANYQAGYLITVKYSATGTANLSQIDNIETLPITSILLKNCLTLQHQGGLPECTHCAQGYRIHGGFCQPLIEGCAEYAEQYCIRCKSGFLMQKGLGNCLSLADDQHLIIVALGVTLNSH